MKASKWFGFPILYLQFMITGLLNPTLPDIIVPFFDGSYSKAALAQGVVDSVGAFGAFMLSPVLGALSDRFGRRPFLLFVVSITALQVWAIALYPTISLWYYFAAKALGKISVYGPVLTYLADCTSLQERSTAFGQATAAIFAALTSGPLICMVTSPWESFVIACVATVINCSYIAVVLPETLTPEVRRRREIARTRKKQRAVSFSEATIRPRRLSPQYSQQLHLQQQNPTSTSVQRIDVLPAPSRPPRLLRGMSEENSRGRKRSASEHAIVPPFAVIEQQQQHRRKNAVSPVSASAAPAPRALLDEEGPTSSDRYPQYFQAAGSKLRTTAAAELAEERAAAAAKEKEQQQKKKKKERPPENGSLNPFRTMAFIAQNPLYLLIIGLVFFSQLSEYGIFETDPLYLKQKLDFTRDDRSHVMVVNGVCTFFVLTVLMPWLLRRLREPHVIMVALVCETAQLVGYTLISAKWQAFVISCIGSFAPMCYPAASSLLSQHVGAGEQGLAQGALSGFKSLTQGFGPLLFSIVYSFFNTLAPPYDRPEATFVMGALFVLVAIVLTLRVPASSWKRQPALPTTAPSSSSIAKDDLLVVPPRRPSVYSQQAVSAAASGSASGGGRGGSSVGGARQVAAAAPSALETAPLLDKARYQDAEDGLAGGASKGSGRVSPSASTLELVLPDAVPAAAAAPLPPALLLSVLAASPPEEEENHPAATDTVLNSIKIEPIAEVATVDGMGSSSSSYHGRASP